MARSNNLPAKKFKAGERTETSLRFVWDAGESSDTVYIDIAKALSQINHRAYRQGLYYYVSSVTFSNGSDAYIQLNTAPDTWQTKLAWSRGFKQWSKMNRLANQPDNLTPKYHDFKVKLHATANSTLNVVHGDLTQNTSYSSDDWVISKFVTADPTLVDPDGDGGAEIKSSDPDQFEAHLLGGHSSDSDGWVSVGLIKSLSETWRRQSGAGEPELDADAPTDPIAALFDYADNFDNVRDNLVGDNDEPPYNHDLMVGEADKDETIVRSIMRTGSGAGALARGPGFCVPFGLIEVNIDRFTSTTPLGEVELIINMVPGSYHGVYAERVM